MSLKEVLNLANLAKKSNEDKYKEKIKEVATDCLLLCRSKQISLFDLRNVAAYMVQSMESDANNLNLNIIINNPKKI